MAEGEVLAEVDGDKVAEAEEREVLLIRTVCVWPLGLYQLLSYLHRGAIITYV